ncbi:MAG: DUF4097 family beta strand repeat-containing protein [Candidatus Muiribacteriaceae bacterium]
MCVQVLSLPLEEGVQYKYNGMILTVSDGEITLLNKEQNLKIGKDREGDLLIRTGESELSTIEPKEKDGFSQKILQQTENVAEFQFTRPLKSPHEYKFNIDSDRLKVMPAKNREEISIRTIIYKTEGIKDHVIEGREAISGGEHFRHETLKDIKAGYYTFFTWREQGNLKIIGNNDDLKLKGYSKKTEFIVYLKPGPGISVKAAATSGDIICEGVTGVYDLETMSGDVIIKDNPRRAKIETMSGDITYNGDVQFTDLKTASGRCDVMARASSESSLKIETMSGGIELNLFTFLTLDFRIKSLSGVLTGGGIYDIPDISGDFDIKTTYPGKVSKKLNIRIETLSGKIDIKRGER